MKQNNMLLHFFPTNNPKQEKPVSYTDKNKLAVINSKSKNANKVKENEDWECEIAEDKGNFIIVNPLKLVVSVEQNETMLLQKLKEKWNNR